MNQFHLILLIFIAAHHFGFSECRRMLWNQRTNFIDATNWEGNTLPCSTDAIVFPHKSYDYIMLSNFTMKEIILPKSGGFVLNSKASINFREVDAKCTLNEIRTYKSVIQTPWLSSSNWLSARDPNQNDISQHSNLATPHDERVPCDNDEIIFPINNSYVVDLQSIPILSFKSIAIDGRVMSINEFKDFLYSVHGQSAFKNTENTLFTESSCFDEEKCACHSRSESLRQQLCENERPFCQPFPRCSDPIKPIGHCCLLCGAIFHMKLNAINNFNLKSFKENVQKGKLSTIALHTFFIFALNTLNCTIFRYCVLWQNSCNSKICFFVFYS
jgi:protein amnionless